MKVLRYFILILFFLLSIGFVWSAKQPTSPAIPAVVPVSPFEGEEVFGSLAGAPVLDQISPALVYNHKENVIKIRGANFDLSTLVLVNMIPLPSSFYSLISDTEIDLFIPMGFVVGEYKVQVSDGVTPSSYKEIYVLEGVKDLMPPTGSGSLGTLTSQYSQNIQGQGPGWEMNYNNGVDSLTYYFLESEVQRGTFSVHVKYNAYSEIIPIKDAGTYYRGSNQVLLRPLDPRSNIPVLRQSSLENNTLTLAYTEGDQSQNQKIYQFSLKGRTLQIDVASNPLKNQYPENYEGFTLGNTQGFNSKNLNIDYMMIAPLTIVLNANNVPQYFYTIYPDVRISNGQELKRTSCSKEPSSYSCYVYADYIPRKGGTSIFPLRERYYLTVSNEVEDILVNLTNSPSPYRQELLTKSFFEWYSSGIASVFNENLISLRWTSPSTGEAVVNVSLNRNDVLSCLFLSSSGSEFYIKKNNEVLRREVYSSYDANSRSFVLSSPVNIGDNISFEIKATSNLCDNMSISARISLDSQHFDFPKGFSTSQGENRWSYFQHYNSTYYPLEWDSNLSRWQSLDYFGYIGNGSISPMLGKEFYKMAKLLEDLKFFGLEDLIFMYQPHQRFGWDSPWPGQLPSSVANGGDEGMINLGNTAKSIPGSRFGIYTQTFWISRFFPPNLPDYFSLYQDQIVKNASGDIHIMSHALTPYSFTNAGVCDGGINFCGENIQYMGRNYTYRCPFNLVCRYPGNYPFSTMDLSKVTQSHGNLEAYTHIDAGYAAENYPINAIYTDMIGATSPSPYTLEMYRDDSKVRTISEFLNASEQVYLYLKSLVNGPMSSEPSVSAVIEPGQNYKRIDVLSSGYLDFFTLPPDTHLRNNTIIPHFARSINRLMSTHGYGLWSRTIGWPGSKPQFGDEELDWYRMAVLGFGFGSYIWNDVPADRPTYDSFIIRAVKEYYFLHGILPYYRTVEATNTLYEVNGRQINLSQAIREGVDFQDVQFINEYANGFKMYLNYDRNNNWSILTPEGEMLLPPNGFALWSVDGAVFAASYLVNGHRVDYVKTPEYTLRDGRGIETMFFDYVSSKYLTISKGGDRIYCEPLYGCFKNTVFPNPSQVVVRPSAATPGSLNKRNIFEIFGEDIHPYSQLYFNGFPVMNQAYKSSEGKLSLLDLSLLEGTAVLEIRNPEDHSLFFNILISSRDGDADKVPDEIDGCPNTRPEYFLRVSKLNGCILPISSFTPRLTSDFSLIENLSNALNFEIGLVNKGKIVYLQPVSLTWKISQDYVPLNLDQAINISLRSIRVNSSAYPNLNKPARLTFNNITYSNPDIIKDGAHCTTCTPKEFSSNNYVVDVIGFSTYTVVQGSCGDSVCGITETCSSCAGDCGQCTQPDPPDPKPPRPEPPGPPTSPYINLDKTSYGVFNRSIDQTMKFTWSSRNYTLKLVNIQGNAAVFNVTPGNILVSSNIPDKGYPFDVTGDSKEDVYIDVLRMPSSTLVTFELGKYVAPRLNETQGNQTIGGEGGEVVIKGTYKTILYFIIGLIILVALGIFVYMGIRWRASKKTIALVKEKQKEQQEYASLQKYNDYMKSLDIKDGDTKGS